MSDFATYIPVLLALVLALTLVTNIIVQVLKGLLYDLIPTNLLAFLVVLFSLCHFWVDDRGSDRVVFCGGLFGYVWV